MATESELLEDTTITHIKAPKNVRYMLKLLALDDKQARNAQEFLTNLVTSKYNRKFKG